MPARPLTNTPSRRPARRAAGPRRAPAACRSGRRHRPRSATANAPAFLSFMRIPRRRRPVTRTRLVAVPRLLRTGLGFGVTAHGVMPPPPKPSDTASTESATHRRAHRPDRSHPIPTPPDLTFHPPGSPTVARQHWRASPTRPNGARCRLFGPRRHAETTAHRPRAAPLTHRPPGRADRRRGRRGAARPDPPDHPPPDHEDLRTHPRGGTPVRALQHRLALPRPARPARATDPGPARYLHRAQQR